MTIIRMSCLNCCLFSASLDPNKAHLTRPGGDSLRESQGREAAKDLLKVRAHTLMAKQPNLAKTHQTA